MKKMSQEKVFDLIRGERIYQDSLEHHSKEQDENTSIAGWVIYIEKQLNIAKDSVYYLCPTKCLDTIRKIAALAVACMEYNETQPRE